MVPGEGVELREELQGFVVASNAAVEALAREPRADSVAEMLRVAEALGFGHGVRVEADAALASRYHDRFVVSSSACFVPLSESCIRGGVEQEGTFRYGSVSSARADHVMACYREVSFDWRDVQGPEAGSALLRVDSMACELAFMVSLAQAALEALGTDEAVAKASLRLLKRFWREHAGWWFDAAAACMRRAGDDYFALVCAVAAEVGRSVEELPGA